MLTQQSVKEFFGYATSTSLVKYAPSESIGFSVVRYMAPGVLQHQQGVNALEQTVSVILKIKNYISGAVVFTVHDIDIPCVLEDPCAALDKYEQGFGWQVVYSLPSTVDLPAGIYTLEVVFGSFSTHILDFLIINPQAEKNKILYMLASNTAQAYCDSGGKSLYGSCQMKWVAKERARILSLERLCDLFELQYNKNVMKFLSDEGIDVDYCSNLDVEKCSVNLHTYNLILIVGHDEYWSKNLYDGLDNFIRQGGNVVVFSGNTGYRQVRFSDDYKKMICYKDPTEDLLQNPEMKFRLDELSIAWSHPPVNKAPNRVIGAGFDAGAMPGTGHGEYFLDYTIKAINPGANWVFDGFAVQGLDIPGQLH